MDSQRKKVLANLTTFSVDKNHLGVPVVDSTRMVSLETPTGSPTAFREVLGRPSRRQYGKCVTENPSAWIISWTTTATSCRQPVAREITRVGQKFMAAAMGRSVPKSRRHDVADPNEFSSQELSSAVTYNTKLPLTPAPEPPEKLQGGGPDTQTSRIPRWSSGMMILPQAQLSDKRWHDPLPGQNSSQSGGTVRLPERAGTFNTACRYRRADPTTSSSRKLRISWDGTCCAKAASSTMATTFRGSHSLAAAQCRKVQA
mmetsp:Transcript_56892/g.130895  ORF Transcript_56892/g.130895 Transcript_56892/m.130895 type:complete len:258 (+) Transcript_56892:1793-2566(+)